MKGDHRAWPSSAAIFLPGGRPPEPGELFRQTDLAASLQYMADEERAAAGRSREAGLEAARDAFYRGDIAKKIVAFIKQEGGLLSAEDLADYHSPVGPPERRRFGDLEVFTCGAWCQGPVLLQTLALLEGTDLAGLGHNSADYVHHLAEALKLAFADREAYYGDPALVEVPLATLISAEYAAERRKMIRPDRAFPEMPPAGELGRAVGRFTPPRRRPEPGARYLLCLRRRPPRQHLLGDAERRLLRLACSAGNRAHPVEPRLAVAPRSTPSGRRRARQAAAADAEPGLGDPGPRPLHAVRHAGRRRTDPGDAAGAAEPVRLRP